MIAARGQFGRNKSGPYWPIGPAALAAAILLTCCAPANAQSKAAEYLIAEAIKAVCPNGDGSIAMVQEVELTGDGRPDLILDRSDVGCLTGETPPCARRRACDVDIYVRAGALLVKNRSFRSQGFEVGPGDRPRIRLTGRKGQFFVQWNGSEFK